MSVAGHAPAIGPTQRAATTPIHRRTPHRQSARSKAVTASYDEHTLVLRGRVAPTLRSAGYRPTWCPGERGFLLDASLVADVVALLEHNGFRVTVFERHSRRRP